MGRIAWTNISKLPRVPKGGCCSSVIAGLNVDVTDRRQAEVALQKSEKRYRTLFEKSADAMLVMDRDRIIDCNEAGLMLFDYLTKEDLLGIADLELQPVVIGA